MCLICTVNYNNAHTTDHTCKTSSALSSLSSSFLQQDHYKPLTFSFSVLSTSTSSSSTIISPKNRIFIHMHSNFFGTSPRTYSLCLYSVSVQSLNSKTTTTALAVLQRLELKREKHTTCKEETAAEKKRIREQVREGEDFCSQLCCVVIVLTSSHQLQQQQHNTNHTTTVVVPKYHHIIIEQQQW